MKMKKNVWIDEKYSNWFLITFNLRRMKEKLYDWKKKHSKNILW